MLEAYVTHTLVDVGDDARIPDSDDKRVAAPQTSP
jgi:hypothetical protein